MIRSTKPCDFAFARKTLGLEGGKLQHPWVPSFDAYTNQISSIEEALMVEQYVRHKI